MATHDSSEVLPQPTTKVVAVKGGYQIKVMCVDGSDVTISIQTIDDVIKELSLWDLYWFHNDPNDELRNLDNFQAADLIQFGGAILELARVAKGGREAGS